MLFCKEFIILYYVIVNSNMVSWKEQFLFSFFKCTQIFNVWTEMSTYYLTGSKGLFPLAWVLFENTL